MASVAHAIGMAQQRDTTIALSQPRGLDRKLRSELIVFSVVSMPSPLFHSVKRISASLASAKRYASIRGRRVGTYTDRTSLVKPALVAFECCMTSLPRLESLASMSIVRSTARHAGGSMVSCWLTLPRCQAGIAMRQACRSFRTIVDCVPFDQRRIPQ